MILLLLLGKSFGISSNLRTMCTMCGAGKINDFFDVDWKSQSWNLVFIISRVIGGFISNQYLTDINTNIQLSSDTIISLKNQGFEHVIDMYVPKEIFNLEALYNLKGWMILIVGGFFVGFGKRYAGGCTSGHAISGLSNLQFPSLIAVIGFFIGGLIMTYLIFPLLF